MIFLIQIILDQLGSNKHVEPVASALGRAQPKSTELILNNAYKWIVHYSNNVKDELACPVGGRIPVMRFDC